MVCMHSKEIDANRTRASALKSSPPSAGKPSEEVSKEMFESVRE